MISGALVRKYSLQFDEIPAGNDIMFSFIWIIMHSM